LPTALPSVEPKVVPSGSGGGGSGGEKFELCVQ
jgi:hypothetical protein